MTNLEKIREIVQDKPKLIQLIRKLTDAGAPIDEHYCKGTCESCKSDDIENNNCFPDEEAKCIERWLDEEEGGLIAEQ